jgi:hypothetical protein
MYELRRAICYYLVGLIDRKSELLSLGDGSHSATGTDGSGGYLETQHQGVGPSLVVEIGTGHGPGYETIKC